MFQSWRSRASVPSWMLLNEGPVMLLCEYPEAEAHPGLRKQGEVYIAHAPRRVKQVGRVLRPESIGVEVGGFRGFASKSKSEKF